MKIVIADTGVLISLIHIEKLDLIEKIFDDFRIANAVWEELNNYDAPTFDRSILESIQNKVVPVTTSKHLSVMMDYGEAASVILYEEIEADYLLIDDQKARKIAESLGINCLGTLGLLIRSKELGFISELKPLFQKLLANGRYFQQQLLDMILKQVGESEL